MDGTRAMQCLAMHGKMKGDDFSLRPPAYVAVQQATKKGKVRLVGSPFSLLGMISSPCVFYFLTTPTINVY